MLKRFALDNGREQLSMVKKSLASLSNPTPEAIAYLVNTNDSVFGRSRGRVVDPSQAGHYGRTA